MAEQSDTDPEIVVEPDAGAKGTSEGRVPARIADSLPDNLLILPITARPFFPAQAMPLIVDANVWGQTIERVANTPHHLLGLVLTREEQVANDPAHLDDVDDLTSVGTVVRVHHANKQDDKIQFLAEGIERFFVRSWLSTARPFTASVEYPKPQDAGGQEVRAYALAIINKIKELVPLNQIGRAHV